MLIRHQEHALNSATPPLSYRPNRRRAQLAVIGLSVCAVISVMTIVNSLIAIEVFEPLDQGNFTMADPRRPG